MVQKLELRIVNEKEWSTLVKSSPRYEYVDEDNMGFADSLEGKAYVRQTYWPDLNRYLLAHEFEHLLEEEGTDEDEHGVRHKKFFKQILAPAVAPFLSPFIQKGFTGEALKDVGRNLIGGAGGFLTGGPIGAVTGASAQALRSASNVGMKQPLTGRSLLGAGGTGAGIGALGGLFGGTGPQTPFPTGAPLSPGVQGAPITGPAAKITASPATQFSLVSQQPPSNPVSRLASGALNVGRSALSGLGNVFSRFGNAPAQAPGLGNLSSLLNAPQGVGYPASPLLGAGIAGFGQVAGPKTPEIPEFGQIPAVQRFGQFGTGQLENLRSRFQGLPNISAPEILLSPLRRNFELQRRNFASQFKAFRPGADIATDTDFARGLNEINQREQEAIVNAQLGFQGEQRQNLLGELGVTESELGVLGPLAQADIDTIRLRTGLRAEEAAQFKQLFGNLGSVVAMGNPLSRFGIPGLP